MLDLTDWSLYFSQRPGYNLANVADAMSDPNMRWIVVRSPQIEEDWHYDQVIRELIGGRAPGRAAADRDRSGPGAGPHLRPIPPALPTGGGEQVQATTGFGGNENSMPRL